MGEFVFRERNEIFQALWWKNSILKKIHTNIRSFQIEDLINREPICIENEEVRLIHENKSVLVTGGQVLLEAKS